MKEGCRGFTAPTTDGDISETSNVAFKTVGSKEFRNEGQSRRSFGCQDINENHPALREFEPDIKRMVVKHTRLADEDGDGRLSRDEYIKSSAGLATDVKKCAQKEKKHKRTIGGLSFVTVLGLICNFCLIYAVLILNRQLDTQNESLVDNKTHKTVRTRAEGNRVFVEISSEYQKRHLALHTTQDDKETLKHQLRKLNENYPIASFADMDAVGACKYFQGYELGSVSMFCVACAGLDTYVTGALRPGTRTTVKHVLTNRETCERKSTDEQLCDTYDNISPQDSNVSYKVQCCGSRVCSIHLISPDYRLLEADEDKLCN